jgi:hypothetical protein
MLLTTAEKKQAEQNRKRLLATEIAVVGLLLTRRNEAAKAALAAGLSLNSAAARVETAVRGGIQSGRSLAAIAAASQARAEAIALGVDIGTATRRGLEATAEMVRSSRIANNFAKRWLKAAQDSEASSAAKAARSANKTTTNWVRLIGSTEGATAYNSGRLSEARKILPEQLVQRVWDADHCKNMCSRCGDADGTIVGLRESFPEGEPGSVHPRCHCTFSLVWIERSRQEVAA